MDNGIRKIVFLSVLFTSFFFGATVYAVPGDLNYQLNRQQNPTIQKTTVITDTTALDECNQSKAEITAACQKNYSRLEEKVKEYEGKAKLYLMVSLASGVLTIVCMTLLIITHVRRNNPPPPSPVNSV